jgi:hypothetical protein
MKQCLITMSIMTATMYVSSQTIRSKDGVVLGDKKEFVDECVKSAKSSTMNLNGVEFNTYRYCSCMAETLIPTLKYKDLENAVASNKLMELLMEDKNFKILKQCVEGNVKVDSSYKIDQYNKPEDTVIIRKMAIKNCALEFLKISDTSSLITSKIAEEYCDCAINKMFGKGYTAKDISNLKDANSSIYNEIIIPCVTNILFRNNLPEERNVYKGTDIHGSPFSSKVPFVNRSGRTLNIKIEIGKTSNYFLFDTGASELIINSDIERELLLDGFLKREDYLGEKKFVLANNQEIDAQIIKLKSVKIGDYTISNVIAAVIKDGAPLCGTGFLDKFKKWELLKAENVLILYK